MSLTEIVKRMRAVSLALDNLQVKGHENLDILLGSMQQLDMLAKELTEFQKQLEQSFTAQNTPVEVGAELAKAEGPASAK